MSVQFVFRGLIISKGSVNICVAVWKRLNWKIHWICMYISFQPTLRNMCAWQLSRCFCIGNTATGRTTRTWFRWFLFSCWDDSCCDVVFKSMSASWHFSYAHGNTFGYSVCFLFCMQNPFRNLFTKNADANQVNRGKPSAKKHSLTVPQSMGRKTYCESIQIASLVQAN